jgi:predicted nuclease with TOPRIM domain
MMTNENGWGEYSRLVLKELETLASGIKELNENINEMKREMTEIRAKEDKVQELVKWKERIDEVASPSQLKELQLQVDELKSFKTQAVTVFAVVQFGMAAVLFFAEFM